MSGLSDDEVALSGKNHGVNKYDYSNSHTFWRIGKEVVLEPMFLMLAAASLLYVVLNQWQEGVILGLAMILVSAMALFQSVRSDSALKALSKLTQPTVVVVRNNTLLNVAKEMIVVGDTVLLKEGDFVPADGLLLKANDCTVDEATLTGESIAVAKFTIGSDLFWAGSVLTGGSAYIQITHVGVDTQLGKLGKTMSSIKVEKTPLQRQITVFVRNMAFIGILAFIAVWAINYAQSGNWATSLLLGLTMAMSILPEEIPVAFSSFMALGAARMIKMGVLTKQPQTVESLGSATVICADKTGTITQEGMVLTLIYAEDTHSNTKIGDITTSLQKEVLAYARWASEPIPFDSMEKAIAIAYEMYFPAEEFVLAHEYPLSGNPPMMTHVYKEGNEPSRVAGKGAVEQIVKVCKLTDQKAAEVFKASNDFEIQGYRVLAIAGCEWKSEEYPTKQEEFDWNFKGLIALENPPKENAKEVIQQFIKAGIQVKMITGDSTQTALAIAKQVDIPHASLILTGDKVMSVSKEELKLEVARVNIFARMYPTAKLRVIEALKSNGEIVAMTGDGVNDGPALKAAHIGVAMGHRGTELAKQAASLVLVDDDLASMVKAIAQGRLIYQNIKKAITYIVSIHIPIILIVTIPLLLNWNFKNILNPIHIIFLELIMGPTCSIAIESEPAETGLMCQKPRKVTDTFFSGSDLMQSIIQGIFISLATLGIYYIFMKADRTIMDVRTIVFATLVLSNVLLTVINSSMKKSLFKGAPINVIMFGIIALTLVLLAAMLYIPSLQYWMKFSKLSAPDLGWSFVAAAAGICFMEIYKVLFIKM
jgi:P-type Ca2+ transporter type 2C